MSTPVIHGNTHSHIHTAEETMAAWDDEKGQSNRDARERRQPSVSLKCDLLDAILLSMVFHGRFAIETCCHYDRATGVLCMYCGDASSYGPELKRTMMQVAECFGSPV